MTLHFAGSTALVANTEGMGWMFDDMSVFGGAVEDRHV